MASSLISRCRAEYGESFSDFAKGCADMGYSLTMTAQSLSTDRKDLVRNLKRFGLYDLFKRPQKEMSGNCRGGAVKGRKRRCLVTGKGETRLTWYPSEPTYHYLMEQRHGRMRNKM